MVILFSFKFSIQCFYRYIEMGYKSTYFPQNTCNEPGNVATWFKVDVGHLHAIRKSKQKYTALSYLLQI